MTQMIACEEARWPSLPSHGFDLNLSAPLTLLKFSQRCVSALAPSVTWVGRQQRAAMYRGPERGYTTKVRPSGARPTPALRREYLHHRTIVAIMSTYLVFSVSFAASVFSNHFQYREMHSGHEEMLPLSSIETIRIEAYQTIFYYNVLLVIYY